MHGLAIGAAPALPAQPRTRSRTDATLISSVSLVLNREDTLSSFWVQGPHADGAFRAQVSRLEGGQPKTIQLRLYRDGVLIASDSALMTADSTAGTDRTLSCPIPAEPLGIGHRYRVTWTPTTGAGSSPMWSASRVLSVPRVVAFGSTRSDAFEAGVLNPLWVNPLTSAGHLNVLAFSSSGAMTLRGATNNKRVYGIRQDVSGSFEIQARMRDLGGGNDIRNGIYVAVTAGKGHVCGPFLQDNARGAIGVSTTSRTADWSGYDGYLATSAGAISTFAWYRIRWNAGQGTLTFGHSADAATWTTINERTGMSQPTEAGVCLYSNSGAIQTTAGLEISAWEFSQS